MNPPDVVVMDIRMPVMDGIQTLTAMLAKDRQAKVIFNTAYFLGQEPLLQRVPCLLKP